ncbi:hypothetical protein AB1L42_12155 [Thalassoglobus sp. JC818]|uniref:hypothetical protein n=1 Tax=Thalassoglobus sp. JC818 TaxID=3232136 RepID=UPI00345A6833
MIRSAFLTVGLYMLLCGVVLCVVEEVVFNAKISETPAPVVELLTRVADNGLRTFHPPEWMAFTFVGVGAVTMMYAIALPRKASH